MNTLDLVVCGAHLKDLPLNHQLTERNAQFIKSTLTAPKYRIFCLRGQKVLKPGMFRDEEKGKSIDVEIWRLPLDEIGSFLALIPFPLGLGETELIDGNWVHGFVCDPKIALLGTEITEFGGWKAFLSSR